MNKNLFCQRQHKKNNMDQSENTSWEGFVVNLEHDTAPIITFRCKDKIALTNIANIFIKDGYKITQSYEDYMDAYNMKSRNHEWFDIINIVNKG